MIDIKKNVGFWQFGERLFLNVYVPLLFASIVDMHIYIYIHSVQQQAVQVRKECKIPTITE